MTWLGIESDPADVCLAGTKDILRQPSPAAQQPSSPADKGHRKSGMQHQHPILTPAVPLHAAMRECK